MSANMNSVSFGTVVIGEKLNRKVQLINKGALGTNFKVASSSSSGKNEPTNIEGIQLGDVSNVYLIYYYFYATI